MSKLVVPVGNLKGQVMGGDFEFSLDRQEGLPALGVRGRLARAVGENSPGTSRW